jgi:hypothetical protein
MTETQRLEQRAFDAVSRCMVRYLNLPDIYFEAHWPTSSDRVDILAIDRAGSGDVHAIELKYQAEEGIQAIPHLLAVPSQYKWIAFFADTLPAESGDVIRNSLLPKQGMGRVGAIAVVRMAGNELGANVFVRPERFAGSLRQQVPEFVRLNDPDISSDNIAMADSLPRTYREPDISVIRSRLLEVENLHVAGHYEAAFLITWSVIESILRLVAQRESLWIERESVSATIKSLHSYGFLNDGDFHALMEALKIRNSLVHGYASGNQSPLPTPILQSTAERLLTQVGDAGRVL